MSLETEFAWFLQARLAAPAGVTMEDAMDDFERLRQSLAGIHIAHHLRGRIRLKLASGGLSVPPAADIKRFQALIEASDGVRTLSLNPLARSCTVEYDPKLIPFAAWADFLAGTRSPSADILEAILRRTYREIVDEQP